jgi:hypothetical protein
LRGILLAELGFFFADFLDLANLRSTDNFLLGVICFLTFFSLLGVLLQELTFDFTGLILEEALIFLKFFFLESERRILLPESGFKGVSCISSILTLSQVVGFFMKRLFLTRPGGIKFLGGIFSKVSVGGLDIFSESSMHFLKSFSSKVLT